MGEPKEGEWWWVRRDSAPFLARFASTGMWDCFEPSQIFNKGAVIKVDGPVAYEAWQSLKAESEALRSLYDADKAHLEAHRASPPNPLLADLPLTTLKDGEPYVYQREPLQEGVQFVPDQAKDRGAKMIANPPYKEIGTGGYAPTPDPYKWKGDSQC